MTHASEVKRLSRAVRKWPKIMGLETWDRMGSIRGKGVRRVKYA